MDAEKPQIEVSARPASTIGKRTTARLGGVYASSTGMTISVTVGDERKNTVRVEVPMETILEMLPRMLERRLAFEKDRDD